jgi:antibiotic biosynthesis monooxygenase (ABM) superfamily enzyme
MDDPRVEVAQGLEVWMDTGRFGQPIRWRMALITFVAVNVLVFASMQFVALIGPGWPFWPGFLLTNAIVVVSLAWVVMPLATRWLRGWLIGGES